MLCSSTLLVCIFEKGGVDQTLCGRMQKCRIHLKSVVPFIHRSQSVLELARHTSDRMSASSNPRAVKSKPNSKRVFPLLQELMWTLGHEPVHLKVRTVVRGRSAAARQNVSTWAHETGPSPAVTIHNRKTARLTDHTHTHTVYVPQENTYGNDKTTAALGYKTKQKRNIDFI